MFPLHLFLLKKYIYLYIAKPPNSFCSTRYLVTYLASLGFLTGHMGRVTLSVGITAMVNSTSNHELYEMKHNESDSTYEFCEGKGYMNGSVKEQVSRSGNNSQSSGFNFKDLDLWGTGFNETLLGLEL